jgi:hypothetical protein
MRYYWLILTFGFGAWHCHAAPFQNLGFDEANTNTTQFSEYPPDFGFRPPFRGFGPTEDLLPGWQLFRGNQPEVTMGYDLRFDETEASLLSKEAVPSIEGSYALKLFLDQSIVQRGDIPPDAQMLSFLGALVSVSINGVELPQIPPETLNNQVLLNIAQYAGQNVELRFQPLRSAMSVNPTRTIDSIAFVVPEPSTYSLLAVGVGALLCPWLRRRFRKSSTS